MANAFRILVSTSILFATAFWVSAQSLGDTTFVADASKNAVKLYNANILGQTGLYVGSEYKQPARTNDEHPFFLDLDWQVGSVDYNGEHFADVGILYDLTRDQIIIEHFYSGDEMILVKTKVSGFSIGRRKFVHIVGPSLPAGLPEAGFYEVLHAGSTRVVARHEKKIEERIEVRKVEIYFFPKSRYYVLHNGAYNRVSNRREMLKLLGDRKQELRSFIQKEKIQFKNNLANALARVAAHYDLITQGRP